MAFKHDFIKYKISSMQNQEDDGTFTIHPDFVTFLDKSYVESAFLKRLRDCTKPEEIERLMKYQFESDSQHIQGPWIKKFFKFYVRLVMSKDEARLPWQTAAFMHWAENSSAEATECKLDFARECEEAGYAIDPEYFELPDYKRAWVYIGTDQDKFDRCLKRLMEMAKVNPQILKRMLEDWQRYHPDLHNFYHHLRRIYYIETCENLHLHSPNETIQYAVINAFIDNNNTSALGDLGLVSTVKTGMQSLLLEEEIKGTFGVFKGSRIANNTVKKHYLAMFTINTLPENWQRTEWIGDQSELYTFCQLAFKNDIKPKEINNYFRHKSGKPTDSNHKPDKYSESIVEIINNLKIPK
jgi:hypothetical protein